MQRDVVEVAAIVAAGVFMGMATVLALLMTF